MMIKNYKKSLWPMLRKGTAVFVCATFLVTSSYLPQAKAEISSVSVTGHHSLTDDLTASIALPKEIGKIQDIHRGTSDKVVVLIQDAHSIPDAQHSIQSVIDYFQTKYGVSLVGLEGASEQLDPQIFRSFPDKELLRKTFDAYAQRGELAGGTAAALFNTSPSTYHGIEDWPLYEEGVSYFLKATAMESEIRALLDPMVAALDREKETVYSKELLEIDRLLANFGENKTDLVQVLNLSKYQPPPKGSELAVLVEEIQRDQITDAPIEIEIKKIAEQVASVLKSQPLSAETHQELQEFNGKLQEFRTARMTPQAFALYLKGLVKKYKVRVKVSRKLAYLVENQKKLKDIEGTRLFEEFKLYADSVKESLFQNERQKALDIQTQGLELIKRLTRLELSFEDWGKMQKMISQLDRWTVTQDGVISRDEVSAILKKMEPNLAFYHVAEKRDQVFLKNIQSVMKKQGKASSLLVAGGFHTEGLTQTFKANGISYVLVMPWIGHIPEAPLYREHMQGQVSWSKYFEVKDGKVNLYDAFVRATRDKLLGDKNASAASGKEWRDQIIRDLAADGRITQTSEYTRFIDETAQPSSSANQSLREKWLANIDRFGEGLKKLQNEGNLSESSILQLIKANTLPALADGADVLNPTARAEVRLLPWIKYHLGVFINAMRKAPPADSSGSSPKVIDNSQTVHSKIGGATVESKIDAFGSLMNEIIRRASGAYKNYSGKPFSGMEELLQRLYLISGEIHPELRPLLDEYMHVFSTQREKGSNEALRRIEDKINFSVFHPLGFHMLIHSPAANALLSAEVVRLDKSVTALMKSMGQELGVTICYVSSNKLKFGGYVQPGSKIMLMNLNDERAKAERYVEAIMANREKLARGEKIGESMEFLCKIFDGMDREEIYRRVLRNNLLGAITHEMKHKFDLLSNSNMDVKGKVHLEISAYLSMVMASEDPKFEIFKMLFYVRRLLASLDFLDNPNFEAQLLVLSGMAGKAGLIKQTGEEDAHWFNRLAMALIPLSDSQIQQNAQEIYDEKVGSIFTVSPKECYKAIKEAGVLDVWLETDDASKPRSEQQVASLEKVAGSVAVALRPEAEAPPQTSQEVRSESQAGILDKAKDILQKYLPSGWYTRMFPQAAAGQQSVANELPPNLAEIMKALQKEPPAIPGNSSISSPLGMSELNFPNLEKSFRDHENQLIDKLTDKIMFAVSVRQAERGLLRQNIKRHLRHVVSSEPFDSAAVDGLMKSGIWILRYAGRLEAVGGAFIYQTSPSEISSATTKEGQQIYLMHSETVTGADIQDNMPFDYRLIPSNSYISSMGLTAGADRVAIVQMQNAQEVVEAISLILAGKPNKFSLKDDRAEALQRDLLKKAFPEGVTTLQKVMEQQVLQGFDIHEIAHVLNALLNRVEENHNKNREEMSARLHEIANARFYETTNGGLYLTLWGILQTVARSQGKYAEDCAKAIDAIFDEAVAQGKFGQDNSEKYGEPLERIVARLEKLIGLTQDELKKIAEDAFLKEFGYPPEIIDLNTFKPVHEFQESESPKKARAEQRVVSQTVNQVADALQPASRAETRIKSEVLSAGSKGMVFEEAALIEEEVLLRPEVYQENTMEALRQRLRSAISWSNKRNSHIVAELVDELMNNAVIRQEGSNPEATVSIKRVNNHGSVGELIEITQNSISGPDWENIKKTLDLDVEAMKSADAKWDRGLIQGFGRTFMNIGYMLTSEDPFYLEYKKGGDGSLKTILWVPGAPAFDPAIKSAERSEQRVVAIAEITRPETRRSEQRENETGSISAALSPQALRERFGIPQDVPIPDSIMPDPALDKWVNDASSPRAKGLRLQMAAFLETEGHVSFESFMLALDEAVEKFNQVLKGRPPSAQNYAVVFDKFTHKSSRWIYELIKHKLIYPPMAEMYSKPEIIDNAVKAFDGSSLEPDFFVFFDDAFFSGERVLDVFSNIQQGYYRFYRPNGQVPATEFYAVAPFAMEMTAQKVRNGFNAIGASPWFAEAMEPCKITLLHSKIIPSVADAVPGAEAADNSSLTGESGRPLSEWGWWYADSNVSDSLSCPWLFDFFPNFKPPYGKENTAYYQNESADYSGGYKILPKQSEPVAKNEKNAGRSEIRSESRVVSGGAVAAAVDALKPGAANPLGGAEAGAIVKSVEEIGVSEFVARMVDAAEIQLEAAARNASRATSVVLVTDVMARDFIGKISAELRDFLQVFNLKGNMTAVIDQEPDKNFLEALRAVRFGVETLVFPSDKAQRLNRGDLDGLIVQTVRSLGTFNPVAAENRGAIPVVGEDLGAGYFSNENLFGVGHQTEGIEGETFLEVVENVARIAAGIVYAQLKMKGKAPSPEKINAELCKLLFQLDVAQDQPVFSMNGRHLVVHRSALLAAIQSAYLAQSETQKAA